MHILVTGGFGYLGSHIADHLQKSGHAVAILSRTPHPELSDWSRAFEVIAGDITDPASIRGSCRGRDIVVHAAALNEVRCRTHPREALLVNGLGTRNMLEEAAGAGAGRFIYLSTFHVYGPPRTEIITEETPAEPITDYAITHLAAEAYCRWAQAEKGIESIILRISNGYGAPLFRSIDRWTLVVNELCQQAHEQGRIVLRSKGTQERDFVGMPDILQAVDLFSRREKPSGTYNVGSGRSLSIRSAAEAVAEVYRQRYGRTLAVEIAPNAAEPDIPRPFRYSIEKISSIGYRPRAEMRAEIHKIFEILER